MKPTHNQTLQCALADLIGAYQAYQHSDIHVHDWKAHLLSIEELAQVLGEHVPEALYE